jgi:hypothetical protein
MDPKTLRLIVSLLAMAAVAAWLLQRTASRLATRLPDPSAARRIADSKAWAGLANATLVSMWTAVILEIILTGRYETLLLWGIVAAAWLVCSLIDRARGRPGPGRRARRALSSPRSRAAPVLARRPSSRAGAVEEGADSIAPSAPPPSTLFLIRRRGSPRDP